MHRSLKYYEAILEATDQKMAEDSSVYIMGLGVPDPKGIFGTTLGLAEKYGPSRVMDMPTSENGMTGIGIGSAIMGLRPIMTHQRVDFFLLALDQLINNGAKWHYMFGGQMKVPLVIRLIVGRGWGQGPQHSQTLHSWFAHIPGLKVVMPATPYDAKGLLVSAIEDDNPVIYIEHRWLHGVFGEVPKELYRIPIGKARVVQEGTDVTVVASSHMTIEALKAIKELGAMSIELIDLRTVKPLDCDTILKSVRKTGRLVVADADWKSVGLAGEIIALVVEEAHFSLKAPPIRVTYPDRLVPTSWSLSNHFYPTSDDISSAILKVMGRETKPVIIGNVPMDTPYKEFNGPF